MPDLGPLKLFKRVHGNGVVEPDHYMIAAWHSRRSITWRWALWCRWPNRWRSKWALGIRRKNGYGHFRIAAPGLGYWHLSTQPTLRRQPRTSDA
jgi:hypothetical protein